MKIAIIGSGISGLGAAHALRDDARITLYEGARRLGGHTNTVDVTLDGVTAGVDTGFLVFNERTYPNLIRLFGELAVPVAKSDMSFAVSVAQRRGAPAGVGRNGPRRRVRAAAQPALAASSSGCCATSCASTARRRASRSAPNRDDGQSLGDFLERGRYGERSAGWYLLPMAAAIWSCPMATMLAYPMTTFARFCHNHGLLQVERPAAVVHRPRRRAPVRAPDRQPHSRRPARRRGRLACVATRHRAGRREEPARDRTLRPRRARLPQRPVARAAGGRRRRRARGPGGRQVRAATARSCTPTPR